MNSKERVLAALGFCKPDRMPTYDAFWPEFAEKWRQEKDLSPDVDPTDYYGIDLELIVPDETPFPSQQGILRHAGQYILERSGWGSLHQCPKDVVCASRFAIPLQAFPVVAVALQDRRQLEQLDSESPYLESRFPSADEVEEKKRQRCLFVKTGGPYLQTSYLRGTVQWLMDLVEDEGFARALAMRVTEHITALRLEAMRRYDLYDTGLFFHDDMASNRGPMFSPHTLQRVLLPCYERMFGAYRQAGAAHILLHCDGNIESILDMMLSAGIDAIHPVEPKAGMDVVRLRERYGKRLTFIGGLDNAHTLRAGTKKEVEAHVMRILSVGRDGGLIVGSHSVGPDVPVENYELAWRFIHR
jgi:uroporphyrinogen decarboxylase